MPTPTAPYGSWKSPITSELITSSSIGLGLVGVDAATGADKPDVYWAEARPNEAGRVVIVRRTPDGVTTELNPVPFYARTRVHEYGGGETLLVSRRDADYARSHAPGLHHGAGTAPLETVAADVYFVNFRDQQIYVVTPGAAPRQVTDIEGMRYADMVFDRRRNELICVREDHTQPDLEAVNTLVAINVDTGAQQVLVQGNDFYAAPRLSNDARLCWLSWNHPNMPWDGCELHVGQRTEDGTLGYIRPVAGGTSESIFQPQWASNGDLYFVSDRSGWWNLYRWKSNDIEAITHREVEFGKPYWQFGMSTYDIESPDRIVCTYNDRGTWRLATIDTRTKELHDVETPYTGIGSLKARNGRVYMTAASPTESNALVSLDLASGAIDVLKRSTDVHLDPGYVSIAQTIEFPTANGLTAYAFYYPPRNKDFDGVSETGFDGGSGNRTAHPEALEGRAAPVDASVSSAGQSELPPLLVMSHGGPTAATSATFSLRTQYWTSRGIAVLDVNYGGSTGYGRAYRERLNGTWGITDVDDCVNGALYLADKGLVDRNRLAITGGSAGGYTTLCVLAFRDAFKAGASHFGVADLEALARDTHKFESRYLDGLVGPYPERRDLYVERSPIHHIEGLTEPMIFFQGLEDEIVPPNQAEAMVAALKAKGVPVAYLPFEGEQHGFRRAENIRRSLDGELYFYSRIFGFELADEVEPVEIEGLPADSAHA